MTWCIAGKARNNFLYDGIMMVNIWEFRNYQHISTYVIEGSLEVKLPTIWTDEEQSRAEAEIGERLEERRVVENESEEIRCRCAKR